MVQCNNATFWDIIVILIKNTQQAEPHLALKKNHADNKYLHKNDTDVIIDHMSIGFTQTMLVFIIKWHKMWLSSPCDN